MTDDEVVAEVAEKLMELWGYEGSEREETAEGRLSFARKLVEKFGADKVSVWLEISNHAEG